MRRVKWRTFFVFLLLTIMCVSGVNARQKHKKRSYSHTQAGLTHHRKAQIQRGVHKVKNAHARALNQALNTLHRRGKLDGKLQSWGKLAVAFPAIESGGNPNAVSDKNAMGLWQVMPGTAKARCNIDDTTLLFDPQVSSLCGMQYIDYLRTNASKFGFTNWNEIILAYNRGEGGAMKFIAKLRNRGLSESEVQQIIAKDDYVQSIRYAVTVQNTDQHS